MDNVDGEPTVDMLGVEPRRYGDYCSTKSYLIEKNEEAYSHVFIISLILMKKDRSSKTIKTQHLVMIE